ncbi:hypothetical protein Bbelb_129020 [Branchiostoma belcheri]|nr:hypothetical protein Bbelb_129020 [Branchiostoma belcheri]
MADYALRKKACGPQQPQRKKKKYTEHPPPTVEEWSSPCQQLEAVVTALIPAQSAQRPWLTQRTDAISPRSIDKTSAAPTHQTSVCMDQTLQTKYYSTCQLWLADQARWEDVTLEAWFRHPVHSSQWDEFQTCAQDRESACPFP